ncbi:hypothetical protein HG530_007587 [Fusarium avenaceum]|nr:hypothetical protein HG530_007587 [Fusarium avenaceum]
MKPWLTILRLPEAQHAAEALRGRHGAVHAESLDSGGHIDGLRLAALGGSHGGDSLGNLVGQGLGNGLNSDGGSVDTDGHVGSNLVGDGLGDSLVNHGGLLADGGLSGLGRCLDAGLVSATGDDNRGDNGNFSGGSIPAARNNDNASSGSSRKSIAKGHGGNTDLTVRLGHGDNNDASLGFSDNSLGISSTDTKSAGALTNGSGLSNGDGLNGGLGGRDSLGRRLNLSVTRDDNSASTGGNTVGKSHDSCADLAIRVGHGDDNDASLGSSDCCYGLGGLGTKSGRSSGLSIRGSLGLSGSLSISGSSGLGSISGGRGGDDGRTTRDDTRLGDSQSSGRDNNVTTEGTLVVLAGNIGIGRKDNGSGLSGLLHVASRGLGGGGSITAADLELLLAIANLEVLTSVLGAALELLGASIVKSLANLREGLLLRAGTDNEVTLVATLDRGAGSTDDNSAMEDGDLTNDNDDRLVDLADDSAAGGGLGGDGTGELVGTSGLSTSGNSGVGERTGLRSESVLAFTGGENDGRDGSRGLSAGINLISSGVGRLGSLLSIGGLISGSGGLSTLLGSASSLESSGSLLSIISGSSVGVLTTSALGAGNGDGHINEAGSTLGDERSRDDSGDIGGLFSNEAGVSCIGSRESLDLSDGLRGAGSVRVTTSGSLSRSGLNLSVSSRDGLGDSLRSSLGIGLTTSLGGSTLGARNRNGLINKDGGSIGDVRGRDDSHLRLRVASSCDLSRSGGALGIRITASSLLRRRRGHKDALRSSLSIGLSTSLSSSTLRARDCDGLINKDGGSVGNVRGRNDGHLSSLVRNVAILAGNDSGDDLRGNLSISIASCASCAPGARDSDGLINEDGGSVGDERGRNNGHLRLIGLVRRQLIRVIARGSGGRLGLVFGNKLGEGDFLWLIVGNHTLNEGLQADSRDENVAHKHVEGSK